MQRRDFLRTIETTAVAGATGLVAGATHQANAAPVQPENYRFTLGIYLGELTLPFEQSLAKTVELGITKVWFNRIPDQPDIADMTNAQVDRFAKQIADHGLDIFVLNCGNPFKQIHLTELKLKTLPQHPKFQHDFQLLQRSMQIAARIGVKTVGSFTFAWPGEYTAGKPTWPMRWLTRGGVIADVDADKWLKAFSLVAEQAEKYDVNVALSMMPWNYTNTTGNFRGLVERLGSPRIKVMWGPADNFNCGEWDTATAGFQNVRPHLHGVHIKDLHVNNGLQLDFEYRAFGSGDVDYLTVFRNIKRHRMDVVLSVSTHFRPPSGSRIEAMDINVANVKALTRQVETEVI